METFKGNLRRSGMIAGGNSNNVTRGGENENLFNNQGMQELQANSELLDTKTLDLIYGAGYHCLIVDDTFVGSSDYIKSTLQEAVNLANTYYLANTKILPIFITKLSDATQAIALTTTTASVRFYIGILDTNFLVNASTYGLDKIEIDSTLLTGTFALEMENLVSEQTQFKIKNGIKVTHAGFKTNMFQFKGMDIRKGTNTYGFEVTSATQLLINAKNTTLENVYLTPGTSTMISGTISHGSTVRGTIFQFDNAMFKIMDSTLSVDKISCERPTPYFYVTNLIKGGVDELEGTGAEFQFMCDGVSKLVMYRDGLVTLTNTAIIDLHSSMLTTKATVSTHELLQALPGSGYYKGHIVVLSGTGVAYSWDGTQWVALNAINATPASAGATGVKGAVTYDVDYIYVCVATDTWLRGAIATW